MMTVNIGPSIETIKRVNSNAIYMVDPTFMKYANGIINEAGEFSEILKNALYYNTKIDYDHVDEELGDLSYFIILACMHRALMLGISVEDVFQLVLDKNVEKLKVRFPGGFSIVEARESGRNREAERDAMTAASSSKPEPEDIGVRKDGQKTQQDG